MIQLIGPGAAGKTTIGAALAERLGFTFVDLDQRYLDRADIDRDIEELGYHTYVRRNIDLYVELLDAAAPDTVIALSSGFMTYDGNVHPEICAIHRSVLQSQETVLVVPSFDLDACVHETVRRQGGRNFTGDDPESHRRVILERFPIYVSMGRIQVASDKPTDEVVDEIIAQLGGV